MALQVYFLPYLQKREKTIPIWRLSKTHTVRISLSLFLQSYEMLQLVLTSYMLTNDFDIQKSSKAEN